MPPNLARASMIRRRALAFAMLAGLADCGGPAAAPPTIVNATLTASADVNAGPGGGGAPVALRVYQLAAPAAFDAAQFFPLFDKDTAVLKDDLVKRDDLLLAPGQSKTLTLLPADRVQAIGVFAAYRDYEHVAWHALVAVPAHQTSTLTITADKAGVTAKLDPGKPAK